jgi:hypothetical protein
LAEWHAGDYPMACGWQQCLDQVLPPLADVMHVGRHIYRRSLAFMVDDELGPHFLFDEGRGLEEVLLSEATFAEPLSDVAKLWIRGYRHWRNGRTHRRRKPLRLVG